jgi:putative transposase
MPRLRHYDDLGTARFITFSCYRRESNLNYHGVKEILIDEIIRAREKHHFQIYGYVLMPEHVHLVLYPPDGMKLGLVIGEIKSRTARRFFNQTFPPQSGGAPQSGIKRVFWQKRCYDHNCRTPETVWEKINYCHYNPVKRELVADPSEWKWSSYNWYQGRSDVPLLIDRPEL